MGLLSFLGPVGSLFGGIADQQAKNRGAKFEGQTDLEQLMLARERQMQQMQIAREQEGRAGTGDAWRKLLSAQRVGNPGAKPQLAGQYNIAPRLPNETEQHGAHALTQEVMQRLTGQNPMPQVTQHPLAVDQSLLDPGLMEKIFGFTGAGMRGAGALFGKR